VTCVTHTEPVLLVGETGTGKTSLIQYLAEQTGQVYWLPRITWHDVTVGAPAFNSFFFNRCSVVLGQPVLSAS